MPRKIRQLKGELRQVEFTLMRGRGKGSHTVWEQPEASGVSVTLAGQYEDDARDYPERDVKDAIAKVVQDR